MTTDLKIRYERGKQIITFSTIVISILGFLIDTLTYYGIYSNLQLWTQGTSVVLCFTSLFYFAYDRDRNYTIAYGLLSYNVIVNILFTALLFNNMDLEGWNRSSILSRDLLFIIAYLVVSGFILGRKHIVIQGAMMIGLISYLIFFVKEKFVVENAVIYYVATIGFLSVLYFFVGTVNNLIRGLEESNLLSDELIKSEVRKKAKLLKHQDALLKVTKDQAVFQGELELLFRQICTVVSENLQANRVSIWTLEEEGACLIRKHIHVHGQVDGYERMELDKFPDYFKALTNQPFILANRAEEDPLTLEFCEVYLKPLSIASLLHSPIIMNGKPIGVLCCENQHEQKAWGTEDVIFIQSMSENIALCYKNIEINYLMNEVQLRNNELVEKSNEIETMNEELVLTNETLELAVAKRTHELEMQNKQLSEYAFINSHILRAPLARILGLCFLLTAEATSVRDQELISALKDASHELDSIIRRISEILYDGNNLSRKDIQAIIDRNLHNQN